LVVATHFIMGFFFLGINLLVFQKKLFLIWSWNGIGTLTIFLKKAFNLGINTSDYDDEEIDHNIAFNCQVNGVVVFLHIGCERFLPSLIVKLFFLFLKFVDFQNYLSKCGILVVFKVSSII